MVAPDGHLRASNDERDEVIAQLRRHMADGRLTVAEYEERIDEVLAASTRADLAPPLRDLPTLPAPQDAEQIRRRPRWRMPDLEARTVLAAVLAVGYIALLASGSWWMWWLIFPLMGVAGTHRGGSMGWCSSHRSDGADRRDDGTRGSEDDVITV